MSDTTFTNGVTLTDSDWFNDVNRLHYTIFGDPATGAAAMGTAISGLTEDTTPDVAADFLVTYDASAGTGKKVLPRNIGALFQGTAQASTSGTSIDFTGVPAGTKRITISFFNLSFNAAAQVLVQIGDSGGIETTGYLSAGGDYVPTANHNAATSGFLIGGSTALFGAGAATCSGQMVLTLVEASSFSWAAFGFLARTDVANTGSGAGSKSTSAELDRVRITTAAGTSTFDAGTINVQYER